MSNTFLVFDIWADYAHFKKPYTTTSPLSFSIPPRTVVAGILGAVAGIEKDICPEMFSKDQAEISVAVKNPVKKVRIGLNLINTKHSFYTIKDRTQINTEFLKDSKYRIYISHKNSDICETIKYNLIHRSPVYTVSLGLSNNIANFRWVGEYKPIYVFDNQEYIWISSAIPIKGLDKHSIDFTVVGEYFTENIPLVMTNERQVHEYGELLFERRGRQILAKVPQYIQINQENICIL